MSVELQISCDNYSIPAEKGHDPRNPLPFSGASYEQLEIERCSCSTTHRLSKCRRKDPLRMALIERRYDLTTAGKRSEMRLSIPVALVVAATFLIERRRKEKEVESVPCFVASVERGEIVRLKILWKAVSGDSTRTWECTYTVGHGPYERLHLKALVYSDSFRLHTVSSVNLDGALTEAIRGTRTTANNLNVNLQRKQQEKKALQGTADSNNEEPGQLPIASSAPPEHESPPPSTTPSASASSVFGAAHGTTTGVEQGGIDFNNTRTAAENKYIAEYNKAADSYNEKVADMRESFQGVRTQWAAHTKGRHGFEYEEYLTSSFNYNAQMKGNQDVQAIRLGGNGPVDIIIVDKSLPVGQQVVKRIQTKAYANSSATKRHVRGHKAKYSDADTLKGYMEKFTNMKNLPPGVREELLQTTPGDIDYVVPQDHLKNVQTDVTRKGKVSEATANSSDKLEHGEVSSGNPTRDEINGLLKLSEEQWQAMQRRQELKLQANQSVTGGAMRAARTAAVVGGAVSGAMSLGSRYLQHKQGQEAYRRGELAEMPEWKWEEVGLLVAADTAKGAGIGALWGGGCHVGSRLLQKQAAKYALQEATVAAEAFKGLSQSTGVIAMVGCGVVSIMWDVAYRTCWKGDLTWRQCSRQAFGTTASTAVNLGISCAAFIPVSGPFAPLVGLGVLAASIACGSVDCHYGLTSSLAEALVPLTKEEKIDKIEQAMAKLREEWMKAMERAKQIADEIFCVHPDASFDEVRRKYRVLAKIYHPDRGGDTQRFQEIGMAYEVLQNYKTNNPARVLASMASVLAVADGQEGVGEE